MSELNRRYANVIRLQMVLSRCKLGLPLFSSGVPRVGPAGLPRCGCGRRSRPRPAERRRPSCRPIERTNVKKSPYLFAYSRVYDVPASRFSSAACELLSCGSLVFSVMRTFLHAGHDTILPVCSAWLAAEPVSKLCRATGSSSCSKKMRSI